MAVRKFESFSRTTGELLDNDIVDSMIKEELRIKNIIIFNKLTDNPLELTVLEMEYIRKLQGERNPGKVNLIYSKGFFMSSQSEESLFEELNPMTIYMMTMCGFRMNKDGLLKYKNGRAIRSFRDLQDYLKLSRHKWLPIHDDIVKFSLIKEQYHDDATYLVVNPMYKSSQYEITMYKFMAFHRELKASLTSLDYLYLCKKFDIIP